jgi:hypothetical protein
VPKFNKRKIIQKIVEEPNSQKRIFWAKEMKLLNSLLEVFPNADFWQKVRLRKVNSLAMLKTKAGIAFLRKKYNEFHYKIPEKIEIPLGSKTGEDKIFSKKPKTIRQFIDE